MPKWDRARRKTDKQLKKMEGEMGRVYKNNSALLAVRKEFMQYMDKVKMETQPQYDAYVHAKEDKDKLKLEYIKAVKNRTVFSKGYKKLVSKFASILADANQQALDIVNNEMISIYIENYNQVAEDCRRVGIKVNGKEKQRKIHQRTRR